MRSLKFGAVALLALSLVGCGVAPSAMVSGDKAVSALGKAGSPFALMTFFALDNDLDHGTGIVNSLNSAAAASSKTAAVSLYDGSRANDSTYFFQAPGRSAEKTAAGEVDSGTAKGLADFLAYGAPKVSGSRKVLSMADHGGGIVRGICSDWNGPGGKKIIHMPEVAGVLQSTPVDMMLFDACFMNMAEVAYELRGKADVVIGAQTTTRGDFPYADIVETLDKSVGQSNQETAKAVLKDIAASANYTVAFGAVDTTKIDAVAQKMKQLVAVMTPKVPTLKGKMQDAIGAAQAYAWESDPGMAMYNNYKDFGDVMEQLKKMGDPAIAQAASEAQAAAKEAVLGEAHRSGGMFSREKLDRVSGMALYAVAEGSVESKYLTRSWSRDTGWGDLLVKINGGGVWGPAVAPDKYPYAFPSKR